MSNHESCFCLMLALKALASLRSLTEKIQRVVVFEMVSRSMFLYLWGKKNKQISAKTTFHKLINRAVAIITSNVVDDFFLQRHPGARRFNDGVLSCLHILIRLTVGSELGMDGHVAAALPLFTAMQSRGASHVTGNAENIGRTPWLAAGMLTVVPQDAKECANVFVTHMENIPVAQTEFQTYAFAKNFLAIAADQFMNDHEIVPMNDQLTNVQRRHRLDSYRTR